MTPLNDLTKMTKQLEEITASGDRGEHDGDNDNDGDTKEIYTMMQSENMTMLDKDQMVRRNQIKEAYRCE
jgi:hypothetical protein